MGLRQVRGKPPEEFFAVPGPLPPAPLVLDGDWHPRQAANLMLDVKTTCTNRDYPMRFLRGGDAVTFAGQPPGQLGPITCLQAPTPTLRPPRRRAAHWRILSQLGLNHKTLTDPVDGVHVLQEMLRLCDLSDQTAESVVGAVNRQIVEGIRSLQTRRVRSRMPRCAPRSGAPHEGHVPCAVPCRGAF